MSPVVSIDKLLYSVTIIFDKLRSGDYFRVDYSINNQSSWSVAGVASYSDDGEITKKEFVIPNNITFNKIFFKVYIGNTNASTAKSYSPVLLDLIMAYKPMPNYKNQWQMRLDMSDGVKLLNKQNDNRLGYDMSSELWNEKLTKERVKFQDIDYFECTLSVALTKTATSASINTTKKLPTKGRIRVLSGGVSEEMYYTSAKTNKILGLVRGARGTIARAYPSGITMDNAYEVYVEDISTNLNFTDENKTESIAQVLLIES